MSKPNIYLRKTFLKIAMRIFQLLCSFICFVTSYGQSITKQYCKIDVAITKEKKKIYAVIENKVGYMCADSFWLLSTEKQINEALQLLKKVPKGKYLVPIQYILDKEGEIADVRPLSSNGYGLEETVLRLIKKNPKWGPATQSGRTVKPYRTSLIKPEVEQ